MSIESIDKTWDKHDFILEEKQEIPDIHGTAYLAKHKKSGARLFYIKTEDTNKVFSIGFKTPPANSCGTPHILEHSVLCGSRKYSSKDPFNELLKGSLNTFLNAMTYADKTLYPVASCNEEDFHNLMDVYLDAVFYPNIYDNKAIFMQEGWRYLWDEKNNDLDVTGVVYNEMKGALSDPESQLSGAISRSLFGETTYGFESGGEPQAIPDLTYEDFLDFHRKYYHPSNSYIYLYGDMDIERCLTHLDEGYLSQFEASSTLPEIKEAPIHENKDIIYESYPAAEDEDSSYFAYSVNVGKCVDEELVMAMQVLSYVLLDTNASVIKNVLLESGLCHEAEGWFDSSSYEMVFSIIAKDIKNDEGEKLKEIIEDTFRKIIKKGIDNELLTASLRRMNFLLKEEDYGSMPKGLVYNTRLLKRWLHGESPFEGLYHFKTLSKLEQADYDWAGLIKRLLLNNDKKSVIVFKPSKKAAKEREEKRENWLNEKKKAFTSKDIEKLKADGEKLRAFQQTEDTQELLNQIPILELSQVDTKPPVPIYEKGKIGEGTAIYVPSVSNGIIYFKLHFDTDNLPEELLPYAGLLADLLSLQDTEKYSYQELPLEINKVYGGIYFQNDVYVRSAEEYSSFLTMNFKLLREDTDKGARLAEEILLKTNLDKTDSLKKIVRSVKIKGESYLLNNSHIAGIGYSLGQIARGKYIKEIMSGIKYYKFITETNKALEKEPQAVIDKLKETVAALITARAFNAAYCCEEQDKEKAEQLIKNIYNALPKTEKVDKKSYAFKAENTKTAFTANSAVQYNVLSADYNAAGFSYNGSMQVLKTILDREYLWNEVRVHGGAYGSGCNFQENGLCFFYSYRDPNIKSTYDVYKDLCQRIRGFSAEKKELTKYILGTINRLEQPKTNNELLNAAVTKVYRGFSDDHEEKTKKQILSITEEKIRQYGDMLEAISNIENYCTIGNEAEIERKKEFFDEVYKLIP